MARGTDGLPLPSPHSDTERYLYRLCELVGGLVDLLAPTDLPTSDDDAVEPVDEPAPKAAPRKYAPRKAARR